MGSRSTEALKRSNEARERLGATLEELERRMPGAHTVRFVAGVLAGSGILGGLLVRRKNRRKEEPEDARSSVTVNAVPGAAVVIAALAWAGVRVFEATRRERAARPPGEVRHLRAAKDA